MCIYYSLYRGMWRWYIYRLMWVCAFKCTCIYMHVYGRQNSVSSVCLSFPHLIFGWSFTEPRAHQLARLEWPVYSGDPPVSASPELGLWMYAAVPGVLHGCWSYWLSHCKKPKVLVFVISFIHMNWRWFHFQRTRKTLFMF